MSLISFLRRIFQLPLWAYGVECGICRMSFISPKAHYDHVKNKTLKKHRNKIPKLN